MNPQRTCIGCRAVDDQTTLVRLVRQGVTVVDGTSPRLPGRGAYVHSHCLELAERRHAIRRAFGPGAELDPAARSVIRRSGS
ncbi:YlxR family protein [Tessaracoccus sp. Y36]